ncbi:hypothetical protein CDO52_13335 [Nocardiopsis gilva YIM 90087]|uniref:YcxB-like protein domain-containing protein n=1 Tax=Nocardiopsis gilva YIM 90087 TaxID=1235441 RepID=A0A223S6B5_9ACTN|nr:YcxB family protein [Nocardiopsis gilva]ASU83642.1 hypothetical protein CDO52_13335 [Nocardiopsis gilva YIM 90087]
MSEQRTEAEPIEVAYVPTMADIREALRVRARAAGTWRSALAGAVAFWAMAVAAALVAPTFDHVPVALPAAIGAVSGVCGALCVFLPWALLSSQTRALHQALEPEGDVRVVVDSSGFRCETRASTMTFAWDSYAEYAETAGRFVLLGGRMGTVTLAVLPKRGVRALEDVDRLRRLLDGKLSRAGSPQRRDR